MSAAELSAWSREVRRLDNQIEHRRKSIADLEVLIKDLEAKRDELIYKIVNEEES